MVEGVYTYEDVPTCIGMVPMEHVKSDPKHGDLWKCRAGGCKLKSRQGVRYCNESFWEKRHGRWDDPNPRVFGPIRRGSREWSELYDMRQSVERTSKSLKQSRRLEAHCVRGLLALTLHCFMVVLAYQATALVKELTGQRDEVAWMVRRVA